MESTIKVVSTPNIMKGAFGAFDGGNRLCSIRSMEAIDFVDPAPDMPDDEWAEKYGNDKLTYKVRVRYPEVPKPLCENRTYSSWEAVLKAIKRRRVQR